MTAGWNALDLHLGDPVGIQPGADSAADGPAATGYQRTQPGQQAAGDRVHRHPRGGTHYRPRGGPDSQQRFLAQAPQVPLLHIEQVALLQRQALLTALEVGIVVQFLHPLPALSLALHEVGLVALEQQLLHRLGGYAFGHRLVDLVGDALDDEVGYIITGGLCLQQPVLAQNGHCPLQWSAPGGVQVAEQLQQLQLLGQFRPLGIEDPDSGEELAQPRGPLVHEFVAVDGVDQRQAGPPGPAQYLHLGLVFGAVGAGAVHHVDNARTVDNGA